MFLTEDQIMVRESSREVALEQIAPLASDYDRTEEFPWKSIKILQDLGYMGMTISSEYGGSEMDTVSYFLAMEEVSGACASTSVSMSVNNSLYGFPLEKFGNHEQKDQFLRPIISESLGAFALSESHAGSDAAAMKTRAIRDGDNWVLTGSKMWITNGGVADYYIVFAKTDMDKGHRGISTFIVKKGDSGFVIGAKEKKLGIRASATTPLSFDNCIIPSDRLLGEEGDGFKIAMMTLDGGRIGVASQALGIGQAALNAAVKYMKERHAFGGPIARFQGLQWMIADSTVELDAARLLTWRAAKMKDNKEKFTIEAATAKLYASEAAVRATDRALQIHGGAGYSTDFPIERYYRDSKITAIYEGTSEILRHVIARHIIGKY